MATTSERNGNCMVNFSDFFRLWHWNHQVVAWFYLGYRQPFGAKHLIAIFRLLPAGHQQWMLFCNMQLTPTITIETNMIDVALIGTLHRMVHATIASLMGEYFIALLDLFYRFLAITSAYLGTGDKAALDIMYIRARSRNNQRALKLAHVLGVD